MKRAERLEISYDNEQWEIFKDLRFRALKIMEILNQYHIPSIVHGSIARGDVTEKSDIDVFLPDLTSSFIIETALERSGFTRYRRTIVQATPTYALKANIELEHQTNLSFPLVKLRPVEKEFYRFGGEAFIITLREGRRVPGVDKRLMLIEPTAEGHIESSIIDREEEISKILGVSLNTVLDRVHALVRRDDIGRTGIFIEKELDSEETFEQAIKKLADHNPAVRRRTKFYNN